MGAQWTFAQLAGAKRTLTLSGAAAPHGRLRREPVLSDGIKLRRQRVFYPDSADTPPTTIVFGTTWQDIDLKGRFSDVYLGKGGTQDTIRQWQTFVRDAQPIVVTWGDIWFARGIVDEFVPGRESAADCTYTLKLLIDEQFGALNATAATAPPKSPTALCQALQDEFAIAGAIPTLPHAGDLHPDFLDELEGIVSDINGFSASLVAVAGEVDAFEEGTFDQLERLRAGVAQTKTALNRFRDTMDSTNNDAALLYSAADADVQWFASKTSNDVSTTRMLAILDEMDREAELARRGRILDVYVAKSTESFESISTRFYGGPDGAGDIRDANGVRYGELPVAGRSYQVPARA